MQGLLDVKDIKMGSEQLVVGEGDKMNLSSLEITLKAKA
jgi:DNA-binding protein